MREKIDVAARRPIWVALSDFYLDNELQDSALRHITFKILESPYTLEEVRQINQDEVFPVLYPNLLSVAGEWAGFDQDWLTEEILDSLAQRKTVEKLAVKYTNWSFGWTYRDSWQRLDKIYHQIASDPNGFIPSCSALCLGGAEPFALTTDQSRILANMKRAAAAYQSAGQNSEFVRFLHEAQYQMDLWAAYLLLEGYDLTPSDTLEDGTLVSDYCLNKIEAYLSDVVSEQARRTGQKWLTETKHRGRPA